MRKEVNNRPGVIEIGNEILTLKVRSGVNQYKSELTVCNFFPLLTFLTYQILDF